MRSDIYVRSCGIFLLCVEILALKVNYTKNLTGVVFAKTEGRSEIFADDFSAMVLRTEENLRNFSRILTLFHSVSGLKCNLDKTFVIPVGNFAKGTMCKDLNLKWMDSFTVLGITIDNRLKNLQENFHRIYDKVDKKIGFWIRYGLTFKGRITVAKSLLLSQYTYVATILDSNDKKITDKIQAQIDLFVYNNKVGTKENPNFQKWVPEDIYQGGKPIGGFKMIKISEFFQSLRLSWIRRYAIGNEQPLNDHWCDILDMILDVTPQERMSVINRGSEFLTQKVLKYNPCLTEFLISLQNIQKKWITPPDTGDNRWEF